MKFIVLHRKNEDKTTIAINPMLIKQIVKHQDGDGNYYTVIYYTGDNHPKYDDVTENFEMVLMLINDAMDK